LSDERDRRYVGPGTPLFLTRATMDELDELADMLAAG
jgi:hypothetical protein